MSTLRSLVGSWFAPVLIHGINQQHALDRAGQAQAQGLDPNVYAVPFPGMTTTKETNTSNTTTPPPPAPAPPPAKSTLPGMALAALVALGVVGAAATGGYFLHKGTTGTTAPSTTTPSTATTAPAMDGTTAPTNAPTTKPAQPYYWSEKDQELQKDGTWKDLATRQYRMMPDGTVQQQVNGTWQPVKVQP